MLTKVKTDAELAAMREGGRMNALVVQLVKNSARAGMSTKDLADIAAEELKKLGGQPTFLGYDGYSDVLCVSVNDEVVHGIPNRHHIINDGDIISLDFGVTYKGMITDHAISFVLGGNPSRQIKNLLDLTEQSMQAGISLVKAGVQVGDISNAIEKVLRKGNLGIVKDLVGHGTGHKLHEEPNIPNYGRASTGMALQAGMTIAIEPMATLGTDRVWLDDDGWTVHSGDRSLAAHFEHTVLVTEDSWEVITEVAG